jgi:hypothetical protein
MLAGREADDCKPRLAVAERGHRRVPPAWVLRAALKAEGD